MKIFRFLFCLLCFSLTVSAIDLRQQGRSVCDKDDMSLILNESEAIQKMSTPIGIWNTDRSHRMGICSGALISKDLFLTAEHCFDECKNVSVTFGYWQDGKRREETFPCKDMIEKGDGEYENDYLIVRLEGNPGVNFGWYDISSKVMYKGDQLMMIHHPGGSPMKVSLKNCVAFDQSSEFLDHRCDTLPGSSGSAILSPDFNKIQNTKVVAVHTLGGCNSDLSSFNSGPSISHLIEISPVLKALDKK